MLFVEDLSAHDQNALASLPEASEKAELPSPQDFLASLENPLLAEAFSALSSEDQEVVFLAVVLEFSDSEIADELHITPAAATKHRQRALGRMRKFIEKLGGVFKGIVVLVREKILVRDVQFWRGGCLIYK
jgi:DNA-directed RNA polymerase specialized sigma24 family protein